jgi:hypothetical protein
MLSGNQQVEQISDGNTDGRTVFDLGELQEFGIDQIFRHRLNVDFDRYNGATVAVALSAASSAVSGSHDTRAPFAFTRNARPLRTGIFRHRTVPLAMSGRTPTRS